jgi:hypothetical protein
LIGNSSVTTSAGEEIGKLNNVIIDLGTGCIAFAIITTGGVLGVGGKERTVPWQALTASPDEKKFVLNVPREKFERAQGYDRAQLQEQAEDIYTYYGFKSPWTE